MKQLDISNKQCGCTQNGTSIAVPAPLTTTYFKPEPRNTLYWLRQFRQWASNFTGHSEINDFKSLLPDIADELIADYIADPQATIQQQRLLPDEVAELQKPQRIVLFYFLKKLSVFATSNESITSAFKNYIAETILGFTPLSANAETIVTFVDPQADNLNVGIEAKTQVKAYVEEIDKPLLFEVEQTQNWQATSLTRLLSVQPDPHRLYSQSVNDYPLPLSDSKTILTPFKPMPESAFTSHIYRPAIAISTALLCLSEGTRKISLKFGGDTLPDLTELAYKITTAAGWIKVDDYLVPEPSVNEVHLILPAEFPIVEPITKPESFQAFAAEQASLLVTSDQPFLPDSVRLTVEVNGLYPSVVRNQDTVLSPQSSMALFGADASEQSVFSFSHPELALKPLKSMSVKPNWLG